MFHGLEVTTIEESKHLKIFHVNYLGPLTKQSPAEAMKKSLGSPLNPSVPGPRLSANTLTREKAPDIMPNPRPTTEKKSNSNLR